MICCWNWWPYHEDSKTWKPCSVFVVSESDLFSKSRFVVVVMFVLSSHIFLQLISLHETIYSLLPDFVQVALFFFVISSSNFFESIQGKILKDKTWEGKKLGPMGK